MQEALDAAARGRTVISVAHRLSTVRHSDAIVVMSAGVIVEQGTHEALVRLRGAYHSLIQRQLEEGGGGGSASLRVETGVKSAKSFTGRVAEEEEEEEKLAEATAAGAKGDDTPKAAGGAGASA